MTKFFFLFLIVTILPFAPANAQVADTSFALPQITVIATRIPVNVAATPVRTQILNKHTLEESAASSVSSLLGLRTTLHVRSYGGVLSSMSQRGASASHTLVLLNGSPILSPVSGQVDLSLLPLTLLNSIEVISGASSTLYGSNAIGGVINLVTDPITPALQLRVGTGSWGRRTGSFNASGKRGHLSGMISADFLEYEGDFQYMNQGLTPQQFTSREGADQNHQSLLSSVIWEKSSTKVQISGLYNNVERGIPTIHSTSPDSTRQWDESLRLSGQAIHSWTTASLHAKTQVERSKLRYSNPRWNIDDIGRHFDATVDLSLQLPNLLSWYLTTGIMSGLATVRNPNLEENLTEYRFASYFSGARTWNRFTIYPSARMDIYEKDHTTITVNPRLGMNIALNSSSTLHLKGSAGRAFRMPTFNDRFYIPGGNPDLRPEKGWSFDTGLIWTSKILSAELTGFSLHMTDQIIWLPVENEFYWSPSNVQEVTNRGLETSINLNKQIRTDLHINGNALWTYTDSRGSGAMRLVPKTQFKAFTDLEWKFLAFQIGARYSGSQLLVTSTPDAPNTLDAYFLMDTQIRFTLHPVKFRFIVDNLLDHHYENVPGNPLAPRSIRLDINYTLK